METGKQVGRGQFLTFVVAGEEYAVDILHVREIIEYDVVTRVPGTPRWVRGVINLRGSVVPVVELALKFGLPPSEVTKRSCIVIVESRLEERAVITGVLADEVSQVVELGDEDISPPPAFGLRAQVEYLKGMAKSGKKFSLVLDIDRVLSPEELHAAVGAASTAAAGGAPAAAAPGEAAPEPGAAR